MGPVGSTLAVASLFSFHRAVRRRPAEHEDVIVETTGFAAALGVRLTGDQRDKHHETEEATHPMSPGIKIRATHCP